MTRRVEVAAAWPGRQAVVTLEVADGSTVTEAVRASGILTQFPEIDLAVNPLGVFGERVSPDRVVQEGERIEIYRALIADPKEARRGRARAGSRGPTT